MLGDREGEGGGKRRLNCGHRESAVRRGLRERGMRERRVVLVRVATKY